MTPPPAAPQSSGMQRGFFVGAGISAALFLFLACVGGAVGFSAIEKQRHVVTLKSVTGSR